MASIAIFAQNGTTGAASTTPVVVSSAFTVAQINVILSAGVSATNVFDLLLVLELSDDGVNWIAHDTVHQIRDLITGPTTAISISSKARIDSIGNKQARVRYDFGQSTINVSVTATV